jgi:hypothetical protein
MNGRVAEGLQYDRLASTSMIDDRSCCAHSSLHTGGDWCCCWFMYKKEEFSNEVGMNIIAGN